MGVYGASKFAIEALAEALSYELHPTGVEVTIVQPSAYATNISNATIRPDDPARATEYVDTLPYADVLAARFANAGDSLDVVRAIVALVKTPAGTRPLRVAVPGDSPASKINAVTAPIQQGAMRAIGMGGLLPAEAAPV